MFTRICCLALPKVAILCLECIFSFAFLRMSSKMKMETQTPKSREKYESLVEMIGCDEKSRVNTVLQVSLLTGCIYDVCAYTTKWPHKYLRTEHNSDCVECDAVIWPDENRVVLLNVIYLLASKQKYLRTRVWRSRPCITPIHPTHIHTDSSICRQQVHWSVMKTALLHNRKPFANWWSERKLMAEKR